MQQNVDDSVAFDRLGAELRLDPEGQEQHGTIELASRLAGGTPGVRAEVPPQPGPGMQRNIVTNRRHVVPDERTAELRPKRQCTQRGADGQEDPGFASLSHLLRVIVHWHRSAVHPAASLDFAESRRAYPCCPRRFASSVAGTFAAKG